VHQPSVTVGGKDAYPSLVDKVAALGFSLAGNHGFVDGNKHIAHAAMETMLVLNGHEITATVDEQEATMLALAAGKLTREGLASWLHAHSAPIDVSNT
jgi:death-on-curing protein